MTLDLFDVLWNIPIWIAVFGLIWKAWTRRSKPIHDLYPWYLAGAFVWLVNSGIEAAQGDMVWMWISAFMAAIDLFAAVAYHDMKVTAEMKAELLKARQDKFVKFRIDDK